MPGCHAPRVKALSCAIWLMAPGRLNAVDIVIVVNEVLASNRVTRRAEDRTARGPRLANDVATEQK